LLRSRCFVLAALILFPAVAQAQGARLEALGGSQLLVEDASNLFMNPALAGIYRNRVFFSLGVTRGEGLTGFDPHGGAFIGLAPEVTLGIVLNRDPGSYEFGNAFLPVLGAYLPEGPGGPLEGPDGPVETSAPLRFPADLFLSFGTPWSKLRMGFNIYYAGGATREYTVEDPDQTTDVETLILKAQTHLISGTVGVSGGSLADTLRAEGWVRVTLASAWTDQTGTDESLEEPETLDRITSMDRDLRLGAGMRVHIGDVEQGFVVSPGFQFDTAFGVFRFDDNLVDPDSEAEDVQRNASANDAKVGLGLAWRGSDLLVQGTAALAVRNLKVIDTFEVDDGIEQSTFDRVTMALPEISIGAEYRALPWLIVRAGIRSSVIGGRELTHSLFAVGDPEDPFETEVIQTIVPSDVAVDVAASTGVGIEFKRFRGDIIVGGLFLPGVAEPNFFSRADLTFHWD
jgi:hypothetical protein